MKKNLIQILVICFFSISYTSVQAQCDDCYDQAVSVFDDLMPFGEGECESVPLEQLTSAKKYFDDATASGDQRLIDHAGYSLMHNIINYLSMLNSCYGECEDGGCNSSVDIANSLSACLSDCGSPYSDALCKTAAYIECQCDCSCDNWWLAECDDDDPCIGFQEDPEKCCEEVSFTHSVEINDEGCCVLTVNLHAPECCDLSISPNFGENGMGAESCHRDYDYSEDGQSININFCCEEPIQEGYGFHVQTWGDCVVESEYFPLQGCNP